MTAIQARPVAAPTSPVERIQVDGLVQLIEVDGTRTLGSPFAELVTLSLIHI